MNYASTLSLTLSALALAVNALTAQAAYVVRFAAPELTVEPVDSGPIGPSFSTDGLYFGKVEIGTSEARQLQFSNPTQGAPLVLGGLRASHVALRAVAVGGNGCSEGKSLQPGESCDVSVELSSEVPLDLSGETVELETGGTAHSVPVVDSQAVALAPTISALSVSSVGAGALVSVYGQNFYEGALVRIDGVAVPSTRKSKQELEFSTADAAPGMHAISVSNMAATSEAVQLEVTTVGDGVSDGTSTAGACASGAAVNCATYNPAQMAGSALSTDLLTVSTATDWNSVQATTCKSSGKWYAEFRQNSVPWPGLGFSLFGVSKAGITKQYGIPSSTYGSLSSGVSYRDTASGVEAILPIGAVGSWTGIAVDLDALTVTYLRGDFRSQAFPLSTTAGTFCLATGYNHKTSVTLNAGQTNFAHPVPAGYHAGWW